MCCMLRVPQIWNILKTRLPRQAWVSVSQMYEVIEEYATLEPEDYLPSAPESREPRWKRNVRNALQQHKEAGHIEWDGQGHYRLPEQGLTILDAVDVVLRKIGRPAHAQEIHAAIVEAGLYKFGAVDPAGVVSRKIREQTEDAPDCKYPRYVKTGRNTFALVENVPLTSVLPVGVGKVIATLRELDVEKAMDMMDEAEFAGWVSQAEGTTASVEVRQGLVRTRKYQRSIIMNLKAQYRGTCQICGWSALDEFGVDISEAHHIEHFSKSLNNKPSNIVVLCPNHHTLVHASEAIFDADTREFVTGRNVRLPLRVNYHL